MPRLLDKKRIDKIVMEAIVSYKEETSILPHVQCPMPDRDVIINLAGQLRQMIFPGYFNRHACRGEIMKYHTGELVVNVHEILTEQLVFALSLQEFSKSKGENICKRDVIQKKASEISYVFLEKLPKIREFLATDVEAAFQGDPAATGKEEIIFSYPGIFAVSIHRLAHELYLLEAPLVPRILSEYAHNLTGIDIHPGATIGRYFFIDHGTGVVIGETTHIGDNVKIYQGVTLGALSTRGGQSLRGVKRHPTLQDNVTVYSGSSILGGETVIGADAVIGSNAFITKSVPPGTKVSIKNPELVFKDGTAKELKVDYGIDGK
ncbi:serine O-acetyltransferase EpsC [Alkalibacter saccharofermentans]|uniref:Serine O-acetyltransferase n=1 Tax=Alkalibacter saccharofermentans DSM 14828 TaxID=1120975 RepID=A0A1M4Z488_9FIRM|nr:serine O-acetyltransferase EpsC [Alkalibacter saccharofermentans]SHF12879.1 serine O-acetyltransferase [Alkalibacter saccharofermentans DSM 14828]